MERLLSSWKEIAGYFGKGVRTVQRWEHTLGLPVYRPRGAHGNIVFALHTELERWMRKGKSEANTGVKTILLLTAMPDLRRELSELLEEEGYLVVRCGTLGMAEHIFLNGPSFDVLICDTGFFSYSSTMLTQTGGSSPVHGKVLLLDGSKAGAFHLGFVDRTRWSILTSPFTPQEILECVHRSFNGDNGQRHTAGIGAMVQKANPPQISGLDPYGNDLNDLSEVSKKQQESEVTERP